MASSVLSCHTFSSKESKNAISACSYVLFCYLRNIYCIILYQGVSEPNKTLLSCRVILDVFWSMFESSLISNLDDLFFLLICFTRISSNFCNFLVNKNNVLYVTVLNQPISSFSNCFFSLFFFFLLSFFSFLSFLCLSLLSAVSYFQSFIYSHKTAWNGEVDFRRLKIVLEYTRINPNASKLFICYPPLRITKIYEPYFFTSKGA